MHASQLHGTMPETAFLKIQYSNYNNLQQLLILGQFLFYSDAAVLCGLDFRPNPATLNFDWFKISRIVCPEFVLSLYSLQISCMCAHPEINPTKYLFGFFFPN